MNSFTAECPRTSFCGAQSVNLMFAAAIESKLMFSADSSPEVGLQLGSVVSGCQSKMVESYMSRHRPYRHAHIRQEHCMNVCAQYVLRTVPCKCALQRALCMHLVQTLMQLAAADGDMQHVNAIMCIQAGCLALKQQLSSTPAAASQSEHLPQRLCARYTHTRLCLLLRDRCTSCRLQAMLL